MTKPNFCLNGQVAAITGARRGIGKEIAITFAEAGADVALCDFTLEGGELQGVANEIEKLGRKTLAFQCDIRRKADIDNFAQEVVHKFGTVDILVNNAGIAGDRVPVLEVTEANYDNVLDTNLKGMFFCSQAFGKVMANKKKGVMVNIASAASFGVGEYGRKVEDKLGIYFISKAGVWMLTRYFASELGPYGIRVNAIAPTRVLTPMSLAWNNPEEAKRSASYLPLGRIAFPKDISAAALFLASDAASLITGDILKVDGGQTV